MAGSREDVTNSQNDIDLESLFKLITEVQIDLAAHNHNGSNSRFFEEILGTNLKVLTAQIGDTKQGLFVSNNTGIGIKDTSNNQLFQLSVVSGDNLISITKPSGSTVSDILRITDNSADTQAVVTINMAGGNASKDMFLLQKSTGQAARYMMHFDLSTGVTAGSSVTDVIRISHGVNQTSANVINLQVTGGTVSSYIFQIANGLASGEAMIINHSDSSNTGKALQLLVNNAAGLCLALNQNAATSTNFYRIKSEGKAGTAVITTWVANNVDPNGALTAAAGDVCYSTNGGHYRCTGTNVWVAL